MKLQQRIDILKDLPRGSMVELIVPKNSMRRDTVGVKMEDRGRGNEDDNIVRAYRRFGKSAL